MTLKQVIWIDNQNKTKRNKPNISIQQTNNVEYRPFFHLLIGLDCKSQINMNNYSYFYFLMTNSDGAM